MKENKNDAQLNHNQDQLNNQQEELENQDLEQTNEQSTTDHDYDVGSTRMYFNNSIEKIARFAMFFSHLFIIAAIFIATTGLSKLIVEQSVILNFTYINKTAYQVITVLLLIFSILSSLFLLLPVLLIRKLKTVRGWAIVWLSVGVFYCAIWLTISIIITVDKKVENAYVAVIFSTFAFVLVLFGATCLLLAANYNSRKLQEAIVESYQTKW